MVEGKKSSIALDTGISKETIERLLEEFKEIRDNSRTLGDLVQNYTRDMNLMEKELIVKGMMLRNFIVDEMGVDL